jgi:hypothetical protein
LEGNLAPTLIGKTQKTIASYGFVCAGPSEKALTQAGCLWDGYLGFEDTQTGDNSMTATVTATTTTLRRRETVLAINPLATKEQFLREFFGQSMAFFAIQLTALQARWLFETSAGNRNEIKANIDRLKSDMRNARFFKGNDMLLFDPKNQLRNGHHRLISQLETNTTLEYFVRLDVPEEELVNIDQGAHRNKQAQVKFVPGFRGKADSKQGTIVEMVVNRGGQRRIFLGATEIAKAIEEYTPALEFFITNVLSKRIKGLNHACCAAVFIRAYQFGADKNKLLYAIRYLANGGGDIERGEVSRLRGTDSLNTLREKLLAGEYKDGRELYNMTERLLHDFLAGIDRTKKVVAKDELFPIPELPFVSHTRPEDLISDIVGRRVCVALQAWSETAEEDVYRLIDIAQKVCNDPILRLENQNGGSIKAVAGRIGRAFKKFEYIDLRGGTLYPETKPGAKRIDRYRFEKKFASVISPEMMS